MDNDDLLPNTILSEYLLTGSYLHGYKLYTCFVDNFNFWVGLGCDVD